MLLRGRDGRRDVEEVGRRQRQLCIRVSLTGGVFGVLAFYDRKDLDLKLNSFIVTGVTGLALPLPCVKPSGHSWFFFIFDFLLARPFFLTASFSYSIAWVYCLLS